MCVCVYCMCVVGVCVPHVIKRILINLDSRSRSVAELRSSQ